MLLVPDTYKDKIDNIQCFKYATYDNKGNIRLDRIDLKSINGNKVLERMTHFGKMFGTLFSIDDFSFSKTNLDSEEISSIETSVTNGIYGTDHVPVPYNFIGIDGKEKEFGFINKAVYDLKDLNGYIYRKANLIDNVNLPNLAFMLEDEMNVEYSGIIGNLSAILTQASLSIPFRLDIILDSKLGGYKICNIKEIFKDSDFKNILKHEFNSLYRGLSVIVKYMKRLYEKEKRHIRIYGAIREFDSYMNVIDVDSNIKYTLHFNNSDHARTLFTTISHLGRKWYDTEEMGDLIETKCITVPAAMYEMGDEYRRNTFENTDYTDNFILSYK